MFDCRGNVRVLSYLLAPLLGLTLLSGCGTPGIPSSTARDAPSATATPLPKATATPLPTATITANACGKYFPSTATLTLVSGLVVTRYSGLGNLAYPAVQIPSSQPTAPMQAPPATTPEYWVENTMPVVTPRLQERGSGYVLAICNPSSQAHTLNAVQVTLAKMTPITDQLSAWAPCSGSYSPVYKNVSGGCGDADFQNEYLHAAFAADAPIGATVTATQTGTNWSDMSGNANLGPLPVTLKPGQAMTVEVGMTQPSAPGYYTYSFALTVDGASTGTAAYSLTSLLTPVAHVWSGAACETSAMQALIAKEPTPTANTRYICPAS